MILLVNKKLELISFLSKKLISINNHMAVRVIWDIPPSGSEGDFIIDKE